MRLNTLVEHSIPTDDLPTSGHRHWSAPNYLLLMDMAAFGFGWSALPRWLVSRYSGGLLKELKVAGWPRRSAVDIIWSFERSLGPAGAWLLDSLVPFAGE